MRNSKKWFVSALGTAAATNILLAMNVSVAQSVPTIGPGSSIGACTVAATGYNGQGQRVALTAGHCVLGTGSFGVESEQDIPRTDWAMIPIPDAVDAHNVLFTGEKITSVGRAREDYPVCKVGQTTGLTCGMNYLETKKFFGDSGGPVFQANEDGTVTLVGIVSSNLGYTLPPAEFTLGE